MKVKEFSTRSYKILGLKAVDERTAFSSMKAISDEYTRAVISHFLGEELDKLDPEQELDLVIVESIRIALAKVIEFVRDTSVSKELAEESMKVVDEVKTELENLFSQIGIEVIKN